VKHHQAVYAMTITQPTPASYSLTATGIADLWWFVAEQTGCLRAFTHVLERYVKHEPDPRELLACVVVMGTNMG
jgi:hypothetical protein